jgi:hypothetical protein
MLLKSSLFCYVFQPLLKYSILYILKIELFLLFYWTIFLLLLRCMLDNEPIILDCFETLADGIQPWSYSYDEKNMTDSRTYILKWGSPPTCEFVVFSLMRAKGYYQMDHFCPVYWETKLVCRQLKKFVGLMNNWPVFVRTCCFAV